VISEYLAKNFSVVNSAGLGDNLPPSKLVALEEFPTAAIAWSPALGRVDGYTPSAEDILKIAASRIERGERSTRMLDAVRFDPESLNILARQRNYKLFLDQEDGPFLRRLHNHQLRSGILFLLAHEASHVLLKHRPPGVGQHRESRRLESEADDAALRLVAQVEGFDLRAAVGLFRSGS
jgi:hypothetical protein